uniref:SEFIR domain-containing protein n=1 Tax=Steinernema glaseri TaxID=37863 RepID=A0A1I7YDS5_9BILA
MTTTSMSPLLRYATVLAMFIVSCSSLEHSFSPNCGDQMHKEIACSVKIVDCNKHVMNFLSNGSPIPGEAHDVRIEPFAKALSKRKDVRNNYQLSVDISWQMPPTNSTALLKAFLLLISEKNGRHETCVFFNVSTTEWTADAITSSPRFHFSTDSMFKFDKTYMIELISLPETPATTNKVDKEITMPHNPVLNDTIHQMLPNCTKYSHPSASKWTAAFKRILMLQMARTIQVQFPAAPEQYCFEAYEVRLLDDQGLEHESAVISLENMRSEMIGNRTEYYGEYNFTNLQVGKMYRPQVIPVERASDGRCLCPVNGDPYDRNVVCSCIAADSKPVMLPKMLPPTTPPVRRNSSIIANGPIVANNNLTWVFLVIVAVLLAVLIIIVYMIIHIYRRYRLSGKMLRIRFVQDVNSTENGRPHMNGSAGHTPLIPTHVSNNVLIIYSHDCGAHEAAVVALAEYLRDVFDIEVHIDQWDQDEIDKNLMDYVSSSILKADKIIIINSVGSYQRYSAKIGQEYRIERTQPGTFDNMFVTQIDQTLQHRQIISVRFVYSSFNDVLPPLTGALQYILPENLPPLLTAILDTPLKTDPRLAGHNPSLSRLQAAITRMDHLRRSDTQWFVNTHRRVLLPSRKSIKVKEDFAPKKEERETEEETVPLVPLEPEPEHEPEPETEVLELATTSSTISVLEPIAILPPEQVAVASDESPVLDSGFISDVHTMEELEPMRIPQSPSRPLAAKKPRGKFIEDKLERGNDSGDSGVISDAEIRNLC